MKPENYEEIQVLMKRRQHVTQTIDSLNNVFVNDVSLCFKTSESYVFYSDRFEFESKISKALVKAAFTDTLDELNKLLERIDAKLAEL